MDRLRASIGGDPAEARTSIVKGLMLKPASRGSGLNRGDIETLRLDVDGEVRGSERMELGEE